MPDELWVRFNETIFDWKTLVRGHGSNALDDAICGVQEGGR